MHLQHGDHLSVHSLEQHPSMQKMQALVLYDGCSVALRISRAHHSDSACREGKTTFCMRACVPAEKLW